MGWKQGSFKLVKVLR